VPTLPLNEIWGHALESDLEECCGLLSDDDGRRFRRVRRYRTEMTALSENLVATARYLG
jgi:hypothetical protein